MNTIQLDKEQQHDEPDLTRRFVVLITALIFMLAIISAVIAYFYTGNALQQQDASDLDEIISDTFLTKANRGVNNTKALNRLRLLGSQLLARDRVSKVAVYYHSKELIWSSPLAWKLDSQEQTALAQLLTLESANSVILNGFSQFSDLTSSHKKQLLSLSVIRTADGSPFAIVKLMRDYTDMLSYAKYAAVLCFLMVLACCLAVFALSFRLFRREIEIIKEDEDVLSQQVSQLSALLDENKQLQRNMKSASSRAVELNERFLRRVGSDLHDGPAQSIGYAVMRLNQVSSDEVSEQLGHEFHAVKEALNESLEEIRNISAGLVLPELVDMSLQEAIHKVIQRHEMKTQTEVKESYFNLPDEIALPIKICAYRFAQEGLNNAYKHGQAEKCRFTAQMIDDVLHLSLKDNGMGFRKSVLNTDGGHLGLMGIKDRIESLGGQLNINSELGVGTAIKVSIKISEDD